MTWTYDPSYRLTSPFGWRIHPISKERKFHRGVDLVRSPSNAPLHAFVCGVVTHCKEGKSGSGLGDYGVTVAIKDDKGYLHIYAHLSGVAVELGQRVERGQLIGWQGNSGKSTGPHLHYEIRRKASPSYGYTADESGVVEPTQYLIDYYAAAAAETEDDEMKITSSQQKMLVSALQQLKAKGVIDDDKWAEKAGAGTLTLSELTWINTILLARQAK